ncbi:pentapeptide repeat-containing protein [Streptomyces arboris]|uniref:pentapeptide repeat-containing protein n=1 Tax=Streptomyces arboris TaxID=2600619 RepID=UPI003C2FDCC7
MTEADMTEADMTEADMAGADMAGTAPRRAPGSASDGTLRSLRLHQWRVTCPYGDG